MDGRLLAALACASSFGFAYCVARLLAAGARDRKRRRLIAAQAEGPALPQRTPGWARAVIAHAWRQSANAKRRPLRPGAPAGKLPAKIRAAGLEGRVTVHGMRCARFDVALLCCAVCAIAGSLLSTELAVAGAAVGIAFGARAADGALDAVGGQRKRALESQLSGALEAWCLGLRSGLSFDRSLSLYCRSFGTPFAAELASAQGEWQSGLKTKEAALRDLAETYDSPLFARVVEAVVRSARFGSPLAGSLEALASEARRAHKAAVEEEVMKAPVKMMVPVGTLILPSMLLLVLGPVLLELVEGF